MRSIQVPNRLSTLWTGLVDSVVGAKPYQKPPRASLRMISASYAAMGSVGQPAEFAEQQYGHLTPRVALSWALLRKSAAERASPFPGQSYPATSVMGMPSAVKPFRTETLTWNSAT